MELFGFLLFDAADTSADAAAAAGTGSNLFMMIFKVVIALYLLYIGVLGRGKLLDNAYTKCTQQQYKLIMRLIALVTGILVLANGVCEYLGATLAAQIFWGISLAGLVALLVLNVVLTDRKAMEAARQEAEAEQRKSRTDPLRAAFVFDEEDEKPSEFEDENTDGEE